jgi:prophage antirepressor-like protein
MNTSLSLSFRDVRFDAVDRFGQPWLQANQVGQALGYSRSDAINTLYQSNADEFTDAMTALVKLHHGIDGAGQAREVRIFSLRGCHLLGMFARTEIAKEFRKWILNVLDQQAGGAQPQPTDIAALAQQLADLLKGKVVVDYDSLCRFARMSHAAAKRLVEIEKLLEETERVGLELEKQCGHPLVRLDIPPERLARRQALDREQGGGGASSFCERIARFVAGKARVCVGQIAAEVFGEKPDRALEIRIGHAMKALGWHRRRECEDGKRSYVYERAKS